MKFQTIGNPNDPLIIMLPGSFCPSSGLDYLYEKLKENQIQVDRCFLDGAPCIKLPYLYKKCMYFKFNQILKIMKKKDIDQILNMKLIKKMARGNTENLRPMIEPMALTSQFLTKESIKNETECCYTFYGKEEKAYKTCYRGVKKAYPQANFILKEGYGHLMYSIKKTANYVKILTEICEK